MRLACLSHAASVQAEPGSNSSIKFLGPDVRLQPAVSLHLRKRQRTGITVLEPGLSSKRVCPPTTSNKNSGDELLLPQERLGSWGQAARPLPFNGKANRLHLQGSNIFFWLTQNQMIKEDHYLACTAKMLEILWCARPYLRRDKANDLDRLPTPRTTRELRAHTLAAYRLFTCQRATKMSNKHDPNHTAPRCRRANSFEP